MRFASSVVLLCLVAGRAGAQSRPVLTATEVQGADLAAVLDPIDRTVRELEMTPVRDPMFDPGLPLATLASYVAATGDALGLVVRVRPFEQDLAVEVTATRDVTIRYYARSERARLDVTIGDGVRMTVGALSDLVARGVERSPGPPRVALVIDDATLRAAAEGPVRDAIIAQGAVPVPEPVSGAARVFLPRSTDASANATRLREILDADRLVLVLRDATGVHLHAIDATKTTTRKLPAAASGPEIGANLAALPAPVRRSPLRSASAGSPAAARVPVTPLAPPTGVTGPPPGTTDRPTPSTGELPRDERGRIVWEEVPSSRKVTGERATWLAQSHLGIVGGIALVDQGSMSGVGLSHNSRLKILSNRPGRTTLISAYESLHFHWTSEGGGFAGFLPLVHGGIGWGVQTDTYWSHTQLGAGGVVSLAKVSGSDLVADLSGVLVLGQRFGLNLAGWKALSAKPDLLVLYAGFDVVLNRDGALYVAMLGIGL